MLMTTRGRYKRAKEFYDAAVASKVFYCYGRTTAWANENSPPTPSRNTADVEEIQGYKEATVVSFITEDIAGEIEYLGATYSLITAGQAEAINCYKIYVKATLDYDELPVVTYRQSGLYRGLVRAGGVDSGKKNLLPAEVSDNGDLEFIDNFKATTRATNQKDVLQFILQF